jgi:hypothetical protein
MVSKAATLSKVIASLGLVCAAFMLVGCAHKTVRFPLKPPLWEDADRNHVQSEPAEYYSGLYADGADKMFFKPLARLPYIPLSRPAMNVNALDEVPNSSWFQNRIGMHPISPKRAAQGACAGSAPIDSKGPWTVVAAKPNGANPGFFIKAADGRRYLLKFDSKTQPQRATSADVIGSRIYWAVGYHAPCNQIVYFRRQILKISPKATAEDKYGKKQPIKQKDIDKVLAAAFQLKDGRLRASASLFLPGKPLGPFRYESTRSDDPNDVIPHEHRRELRGNRILSAWLLHHDSREQNTLDLWVKDNGRNYIRHYMLDFGDCFGGLWFYDPLTRRLGHSYVWDWQDIATDTITLGLVPRPWNRGTRNKEAEIFGYFKVEDFVPSKFKSGYPNAAFSEIQHGDALWMARILSKFTDAHIREIVKTGKITDKRAEAYLVKTLIGRRDAIMREYFTRYAPFSEFRLVRRKKGSLVQSLCFEDIALKTKVIKHERVLYKFRFYGGKKLDQELGWLQFAPDPDHPHRSCVQLPIGSKRPADLAPKNAPDDHPLRYGVLKVWVNQEPNVPPTSSMSLHFYDLGAARGFRLVGIKRPPRPVKLDNF